MDPSPEDLPAADLAQLAAEQQANIVRAALGAPLASVIHSMVNMMGFRSLGLLAGVIGNVFEPHEEALAKLQYDNVPPKLIEFIEGVRAAVAHGKDMRAAAQSSIIQPPSDII